MLYGIAKNLAESLRASTGLRCMIAYRGEHQRAEHRQHVLRVLLRQARRGTHTLYCAVVLLAVENLAKHALHAAATHHSCNLLRSSMDRIGSAWCAGLLPNRAQDRRQRRVDRTLGLIWRNAEPTGNLLHNRTVDRAHDLLQQCVHSASFTCWMIESTQWPCNRR